jgi:hypothetical protein
VTLKKCLRRAEKSLVELAAFNVGFSQTKIKLCRRVSDIS